MEHCAELHVISEKDLEWTLDMDSECCINGRQAAHVFLERKRAFFVNWHKYCRSISSYITSSFSLSLSLSTPVPYSSKSKGICNDDSEATCMINSTLKLSCDVGDLKSITHLIYQNYPTLEDIRSD